MAGDPYGRDEWDGRGDDPYARYGPRHSYDPAVDQTQGRAGQRPYVSPYGSPYEQPMYESPYGSPYESYPQSPYEATYAPPSPAESTVGVRRHAAADDDGDDGDEASWRGRVRDKRKNMPLWQELPLLLIVAFCLAVLIRTFLLQAFYIPSGSMEETLLVRDRVLVNKIVYDMREPARGEVVVFRGPDNWAPENRHDPNVGFFAKLGRTVGDLVGISQPGEKDFIKRVIGVPGDTVSCCDVNGRVYVNGYAIDESSYVTQDSPIDVAPSSRECRSRRFDEVRVEPGQLFVMGDHRAVSQDSRCQGQVPIEDVIGRAFVIVWPSGRWGTLPVPKTFENVPRPSALGPPGPPGPNIRRGSQQGLPSGLTGVAFVVPFAATAVVPARSRRTGGTKDVRSGGD